MISLRPLNVDDDLKIESWALVIEYQNFMSRFRPRYSDALCRIIQVDSRDVGYVWIEPAMGNRSEGVLGILIGDTQWWGAGVGRNAIELIIAEAQQSLFLESITLHVRSTNERAYRCYLAAAFLPIGCGEKISPTGDIIHYTKMQRILPAFEQG